MDADAIAPLLASIRNAISAKRHDDDVALPLFDPDRNDCAAAGWCDSVEALAEDLNWSSLKTAARAGKALKGSALLWFESWEPAEGRSWVNFRSDITDAYPERRNLSEKLCKAVVYTSSSANSYSDYAREKIRLLRNTKIAFTNEQIIELVCGGISEVDVKMASLNSGVTSTSLLISLLSTHVKPKSGDKVHIKDGASVSSSESAGPSNAKRSRLTGELVDENDAVGEPL